MSLPFDALRRSAAGVTVRFRSAVENMSGAVSDGAAGVAVVLRNAGHALRSAQGETKLALCFAVLLAILACLPEQGPVQRAEAAAVASGAPPSDSYGGPTYDREPWRAVPARLAAWRLESPQLLPSGPINRARSLPDGSRQELLVWSSGAASRLSGALSIERYLVPAPEPESLYVETARRAALSGASVGRMAQAVAMQTKFGAFESADAIVETGSGARQCIAFRPFGTDAPVQISGWFCGSGQPLDRSTLTCLIDRLDLVNSGEDAALRGWFAAAERNRNGCETGKPGSARWLDAGAKMPALKRDVTGSIARTSRKGG